MSDNNPDVFTYAQPRSAMPNGAVNAIGKELTLPYRQPGSQQRLRPMHRVLVVGSPGSGKSTFARSLCKKTGLPLYYLDMLWHRADHTTVGTEVFDERLAEILAEPEWIIDGNYQRTLPTRLKAADTVFHFDLPVEVCLDGIRTRLGTKRPDMPWAPETELDPEFVQYVQGFPETKLPWLRAQLASASDNVQIFVFGSHKDAHRFLEALP